MSLVKEDLQLFLKRLRKKYGSKIRFFSCGEYGDLNNRPHYHACIFNLDFDDRELWKIVENIPLYRSEKLNKIWGKGFTTIGDVTFESAAYVARYVMKKITGEKADDYYKGRVPEFVNMSRRPGIGRKWIEQYMNDVYSYDKLVARNDLTMRPTKYYDKVYDSINHDRMEVIKKERQKKHKPEEMQAFRLRCKREITERKLKKLKRGLDYA